MTQLPREGYLALPVRLSGGKLKTCTLDKSIERFIQLNLNVPSQGRDRPRWLPADPRIGCRYQHLDFDAVVLALYADSSSFVGAIKDTVRAVEPRVRSLEVGVEDVRTDDVGRRRRDGSVYHGVMKRVTLRCRRVDEQEQHITYDVAFAGPGPVFPEEER